LKEVPVKEGDIVELEIHDLNHQGEGVGKVQRFTVFLPGTVPGDRLTARITSVQKNYCRAAIHAMQTFSPARTEPPCPYYQHCGGCQLQRLNYPAQLRWKQKRLDDTLQRLGGLDIPVHQVRSMDNPFRYRNKARVQIELQGGRIRAGFFQKHSHQVVDVKDCLIQHPVNVKVIQHLRSALQDFLSFKRHSLDPKDIPLAAVSRVSFATGKAVLILEVAGSPSRDKLARQLAQHLQQDPGELSGIVLCQGQGRNLTYTSLWGEPHLTENLEGLTLFISPPSFYQVNPLQARELYRLALENVGSPEISFDIFCGIGSLSLLLARLSSRVVGIEASWSAVKDARENAVYNGVKHLEFHQGRAEDNLRLLQSLCRPQTIVVDPPRKGCHPYLLKNMVSVRPEKIVYLSCEPSTLARDLHRLKNNGYLTRSVYPVDMFPHTTHVEAVATLTPE